MLPFRALIVFVETRDPFQWRGYLYAIGIFCASLLGVLCFHHHFNVAYTTGMGVRTALTTAIYRKVGTLVAAGIINRAHAHT